MASTTVTGDLGLVTAYGAALAGGYTGSESDFYKSLAYLAKNGGIIHPVGSVYMSSEPTSPASLFGGTWERIKDRFILAAGDTYAAGSTGGEAEHTLTISETPNHTHRLWVEGKTLEAQGRTLVTSISANQHTVDISQNLWMNSQGGSKSHNNMPPYLTAYIWRRIA